MLGAFAEFEREKIIERTTRGWRHRIRSGAVVSQGNRIFGYDWVPALGRRVQNRPKQGARRATAQD
jgi:DNA invertase Pin-like site-specific DNA recombinase